MDKYDFIQYAANRYGIDESVAETMLDMFAISLQELIAAGQSVEIDGVGEFKTTAIASLFPSGLNHKNVDALAKIAKHFIVSFTPCKNLTKGIA